VFKIISLSTVLSIFLSTTVIADQDVGVGGVDYKKIVEPAVINIFDDMEKLLKFCGKAVHGCAQLGFGTVEGERVIVCNIYLRFRDPEKELTKRHELKHCYGWVHDEMPRRIQRAHVSVQRRWLDRAHNSPWKPIDRSLFQRPSDKR